MRTTLVNTIACLLLALPVGASAEDAQTILEKVWDLQMERREGVDNYVIDQSIMGNRLIQLYERLEVTGADGESHETFRVVPLEEIESRRDDNPDAMSAAQLEQFAKGAEMTGARCLPVSKTVWQRPVCRAACWDQADRVRRRRLIRVS